MSRQDDRFFNVFSAVLGNLIAITIGVFVFARILGGDMVEMQTASDPQLQQEVVGRIRPFGQVAVAGKDNAALGIAPPPGAAAQPAAATMPGNGEETYNAVCAVSHGAGHRRRAESRRQGRMGGAHQRRAMRRCTSTPSRVSRARPASCPPRAAVQKPGDRSERL